MAGLYYERIVDMTTAALGIPESEELEGAGGEGAKEVTGLLTLSVRGSKQGAVCTGPIQLSSVLTPSPVPMGTAHTGKVTGPDPARGCAEHGHVTSPRTGECIACPLRNDMFRDSTCSLNISRMQHSENETSFAWLQWVNEGGIGGGGEGGEGQVQEGAGETKPLSRKAENAVLLALMRN
jgi:hypothetical protein